MEDLIDGGFHGIFNCFDRDSFISARIVWRQSLIAKNDIESKPPKNKRGSHTLRHTRYFHCRQKHLEAWLDGAKDDVGSSKRRRARRRRRRVVKKDRIL